MPKRILAINDISCIGRCSLTVALPVISAAGVECSVLPTAVLSTHTGGFDGFTFRDLTDDIAPVTEHWARLGITFDAVYTGYLGSIRQIGLILDAAEHFVRPGVPLIVDPVMGDAGRLYANFDSDFVAAMRTLCARADIITPNLTEASFLLGEEYRGGDCGEDYIRAVLERLTALGAGAAVLTGVSFAPGEFGAAYLNRSSGEYGYFAGEYTTGFFHGAGDVFASVLSAAVVRGKSIPESVSLAVDFTGRCIKRSAEIQEDSRFGLCFEGLLGQLANCFTE